MGFVVEEWPICCLGQARVTVEGLRCRVERDLSSAVLATFVIGQVVDVWCRVADWWEVQVRAADGVTGWSWGESLEMV